MKTVDDDISVMERHGQTILALVILAAITWTGNTLISTNTDIKVLTEKVGNLENQLTVAAASQYTINQAIAETKRIDEKFINIERRLNNLEK